MKEFIEKLIGRLEEIQERYDDVAFAEMNENGQTLDFEYAHGKKDGVEETISIVNQLAEEYNNGWIPVSSGNPKETGLYQVTVDDNDEPVITAMYLAEVDIWSYHVGYENYMKVLAWRSLTQPYQPKRE